jgi:predicted naringenin-chalcone synthase
LVCCPTKFLKILEKIWAVASGANCVRLALMFIKGLGTAAPPHRYTQKECWVALEASPLVQRLTPRSRGLLKKVLTGRNGIAARHLALDALEEAFEISPDTLHSRFARHAPALAARAAESALVEAGNIAGQIDSVIVSTCTGYLCPGLTSYVSEQLGLRPDVFALDLVGQGCGAALPNLRMAESLLLSGRVEHVLCVSVEVCSAAFYLDDDRGVLISACLFGDGAGAAVVSSAPPTQGRRVRWKTAGSILSPKDRDLLRFETKNGMLRNVLSPCVPILAARHAGAVFAEVTARAGINRSQIAGWILHAGGRDVLSALQETFALADEDVRSSAKILEEFGNLSSPFVLFSLQAALADNIPDGLWWLSSFGAGFSCHGALLEVG